jgi:ABC-type bacteriocin/lantibiotic exporter with double-glycine peptidase domain
MRGGDVILLHDGGHRAMGADRAQTVIATENLIRRYRDQGYEFVTVSTCGPTSAATLLKEFGQNASEEELPRESFTYRGGTEIWYVARAFRRRRLTADFLIQARERISPPAPAIAGVVLPGGAGHFIAILSESADAVTVGDPLRGKLVIPRNELASAYHFTGFFLVIRPRRPTG